MNIDQFVAKYNGVHIDEDGYYGAQCWDVVARYAREVVGCPSFPTGSGGAEGLYRIFANPIPQYFDRLSAGEAQRGDIGVCPASFSPPWGHTFLILSRNGNTLQVLEQNGNKPDGNSYVTTRYVSQMSGILRPKPKGEPMSKTDLNIARILSFGILGRDGQGVGGQRPNSVNGDSDGDLNANHVNVETNASIWNMWNSLEAQSYRNQEIPQVYALARQTKAVGQELTNANNALATLKGQIDELSKRPTQSQLDEIKKTVDEANDRAIKAQAELEKYKTEDKATENAVIAWLKALFRIGSK